MVDIPPGLLAHLPLSPPLWFFPFPLYTPCGLCSCCEGCLGSSTLFFSFCLPFIFSIASRCWCYCGGSPLNPMGCCSRDAGCETGSMPVEVICGLPLPGRDMLGQGQGPGGVVLVHSLLCSQGQGLGGAVHILSGSRHVSSRLLCLSLSPGRLPDHNSLCT